VQKILGFDRYAGFDSGYIRSNPSDLDPTAARGWGSTGGSAGVGGDGTRQRAAAISANLAVNGRPGSVSCAAARGERGLYGERI
jgi:hypothetical protein